jgi:hypothetical protein
MKTSELSGAALDWAVHQAWCEGACHDEPFPSYSTNWAPSGSIIERERISVGDQTHLEGQPEHSAWYATNRKGAHGFGTTPLVAAMRCYVASKLGDTIDTPKKLTGETA